MKTTTSAASAPSPASNGVGSSPARGARSVTYPAWRPGPTPREPCRPFNAGASSARDGSPKLAGLALTTALLAEMAPPIDFIEAATGRNTAELFPVLT